jgi:hypothetical protein
LIANEGYDPMLEAKPLQRIILPWMQILLLLRVLDRETDRVGAKKQVAVFR